MNPGADVDSVAALEDWHHALVLFRTEGLDALSSLALDIRRAYDYLDDQLQHWKSSLREAEEDIVAAKADLFRRQFPDHSGRIPDCSLQEENLRKAKARYEFIEDKIATVRRWHSRLPKLISEVYESKALPLGNFLEGSVPQALAQLQQQIDTLHAYLETRAAPPRPVSRPKEDNS